MPVTPAELAFLPTGTPRIEKAVQCVREHTKLTQASADVQAALKRRLKQYVNMHVCSLLTFGYVLRKENS